MHEFSHYPVIMITKVQKLHMVVHNQQKPQEIMCDTWSARGRQIR